MPQGLHAHGDATSSASTSSCACAGWSAPSRISRPTSARGPRRSSTTGCPTATPPRERSPSPTSAPRTATSEPFNVKYWGVGNESWGCGGNMSGGEYATEYRKYIAQVPGLPAPVLRGHRAARALRRRRRRLDRGFLRGPAERARAGRAGWTASRCTTTPTSGRPPKTAPSSTRRAGTRSCTRAPTSRSVIDDHWRIMGQLRSRAPHASS